MINKTISIAGLGWLGQPLAVKLISLGYTVKGSVTSLEKAMKLQKKGINAFPVEISESGVQGEVKAVLNEVDYLMIMIPPGLRGNTGSDYVLKMTHFLEEIKRAKVEKVILVSSTSVYDESQGKVTEKDEPMPQTIAGKQLRQVEELFFHSDEFKTTVVRFGGLIGGSRQPARYLEGRKDLSDANAIVNLIHRQDCIGILTEILKKDALGYVFNGVNPEHPNKAEYYIQKANELGLEPPHFSEPDLEHVYKQVDSNNLKGILGYEFVKEIW